MEHLLPRLEPIAQEINDQVAQQPATTKPTDPTSGIRLALSKADNKRDVLTDKMPDSLLPDDVYQRLLAGLVADKDRLKERLEDLTAAV